MEDLGVLTYHRAKLFLQVYAIKGEPLSRRAGMCQGLTRGVIGRMHRAGEQTVGPASLAVAFLH